MSNTNQLIAYVHQALSGVSPSEPISVEGIANLAYLSIDPDSVAPPLVAWAAVLELRQLTRSELRATYERPGENDDTQGLLFEGLQPRYPGFGDDDGLYVPRAMMSLEDYRGNIKRLRRQRLSIQEHETALREEMNAKIAAGMFVEP